MDDKEERIVRNQLEPKTRWVEVKFFWVRLMAAWKVLIRPNHVVITAVRDGRRVDVATFWGLGDRRLASAVPSHIADLIVAYHGTGNSVLDKVKREVEGFTPAKRGPGRSKGSKNKSKPSK